MPGSPPGTRSFPASRANASCADGSRRPAPRAAPWRRPSPAPWRRRYTCPPGCRASSISSGRMAVRDQRRGGRDAGRTGADDDDARRQHPPASVKIRIPSATWCRAGAHAVALADADPAILAGAHQAEPGARLAAEFQPAQRCADASTATSTLSPSHACDQLAVDEDAHGGGLPRQHAHDQAGSRRSRATARRRSSSATMMNRVMNTRITWRPPPGSGSPAAAGRSTSAAARSRCCRR